jgi:predicted TIM-barrel fold metal-dependent hydrolase
MPILGGRGWGEGANEIMIIEWNHHLFSSDTVRYPWHAQATYIPQDTHTDPLSSYVQLMDARGVTHAVVVQPEPYGDDHSVVLNALVREPKRLRASSLFYPKDVDAPRKLEALIKREPRIVATRFHAHRGKEMYLDNFADAGVRALWAKAAELNLIIELHIGPNYAQGARQLIEAFPNTPVLIDHLCEPLYGTIWEYADVLALTELPNVTMKLSGLGHIAKDGPDYLSIARLTKLLANVFGPERVVWGGASPETIRKHLAHWSETNIVKVLGGNLAQLFA